MDKDSSSSEDSNHATPTLLGIPAELRNRIYRYALVVLDDHLCNEVYIDEDNYHMPGILRASRQLRDEGTQMYLEENSFVLGMNDFKFAPQRQHWIWTKVGDRGLYKELEGQISLGNINKWLKQFWRERDPYAPRAWRWDEYDETSPTERIAIEAFNIVETLFDTPWRKVKEVLSAFWTAAYAGGIED